MTRFFHEVYCRSIMLPMITITIAFLVGAGIFIAIWAYVRFNPIQLWGKNAALTFTPPAYRPLLGADRTLQYGADGHLMQVPTGEFVSFEPRHERYTKIAEVLTAVASASLVFVPNSRLNIYPHSCAFALVLLGFSVLYCVGFMALLTYFYEGFLYEPNSYSPGKYGLVQALGFGGLACFALAYVWLAARVGWAFVYAGGVAPKPFP